MPVCLMHSLDKSKEPVRSLFEAELKTMLGNAAEECDFTLFVFPAIDLGGRRIASACNFYDCLFLGKAEFARTVFLQSVSFEASEFQEQASFREATFIQEADFFNAHFKAEACFAQAVFRGPVFLKRRLYRHGRLSQWSLLKDACFRITVFHGRGLKPNSIFGLALFSHAKTLFYRTDLSHALFYNCDVSRINFSLVDWQLRRGSGKRMLFEELLPLASSDAGPLRTPAGERHWG